MAIPKPLHVGGITSWLNPSGALVMRTGFFGVSHSPNDGLLTGGSVEYPFMDSFAVDTPRVPTGVSVGREVPLSSDARLVVSPKHVSGVGFASLFGASGSPAYSFGVWRGGLAWLFSSVSVAHQFPVRVPGGVFAPVLSAVDWLGGEFRVTGKARGGDSLSDGVVMPIRVPRGVSIFNPMDVSDGVALGVSVPSGAWFYSGSDVGDGVDLGIDVPSGALVVNVTGFSDGVDLGIDVPGGASIVNVSGFSDGIELGIDVPSSIRITHGTAFGDGMGVGVVVPDGVSIT